MAGPYPDDTPRLESMINQAFEAAGALSVTSSDAADKPLLEPGPGETPLWEQLVMTGLFQADIDQRAVLLQKPES